MILLPWDARNTICLAFEGIFSQNMGLIPGRSWYRNFFLHFFDIIVSTIFENISKPVGLRTVFELYICTRQAFRSKNRIFFALIFCREKAVLETVFDQITVFLGQFWGTRFYIPVCPAPEYKIWSCFQTALPYL